MTNIVHVANNIISAGGTGVLAQSEGGIANLFARSGTVAIIDLVIILIFSVLSWAIIFHKYRLLKKARKNSMKFYDIFNKNKNDKLSRLYSFVKGSGDSHILNVFKSGYHELVYHCRAITKIEAEGSNKEDMGIKKLNENIHILERSLSMAISNEVTKLERGLFFLATTGSTCPFLGLFGTIWGVMNAFSSIGKFGSPNLANIAPGISDALVTTAAGLVAAIPAAVAYNLFNNSIKILISEMENFSLEFLSLIEKKL